MHIVLEMPSDITPAYHIVHLSDVISAHKSGFLLFNSLDEFKEYDTASLIDTYMRTSKARRGMDEGATAWLGNVGGENIIFTTDKSLCTKGGEKMDEATLEWMAEAYTVLQWMHCLKSKDISEVLPARRMESLYKEMVQLSRYDACEKLLIIYNNEHSPA